MFNNEFVTAYDSFITRNPSNHQIEALTDTTGYWTRKGYIFKSEPNKYFLYHPSQKYYGHCQYSLYCQDGSIQNPGSVSYP